MQQYSIAVDQKGTVRASNFLPMIEVGVSIGDALPIYSYLESFRSSDPFMIEGYDFKIGEKTYIVDTKITFEDPFYKISLFDRTGHYQNKILSQTSRNKAKIEKEYEAIRYDMFKAEASHLMKVSDSLKYAVGQALAEIKSDFDQLPSQSKETIKNDSALDRVIEKLNEKLQLLESKLKNTSKINRINPIDLFEQPKHLTLKNEIDEVIEQNNLADVNIQNKIADDISIFCNEDYGKNMVSHFLDPDKINGFQDIEIKSLVSENGVVEVQFSYMEEEEKNQHLAEMQQILLPANEEVLKDTELMRAIIQNLSNIYVNEINASMLMR